MLDLSIIIPAYNEEDRIALTLQDFSDVFGGQKQYSWEIIVALNGCRDRTEEIVHLMAKNEPRIRWKTNHRPIGKGGAIKEGIECSAPSRMIGFVDADGSTPAEAFLDIVRAAEKCEIAVGSRWLAGSVIEKAQSNKRKLLSRTFNLLVNGLFFFGLKDTQCGAKVFKAETILNQLDSLIIADMAFDVNLLFLIKRSGGRIHEIPTTWTDREGSKVRVLRTSLSMTLSVIRLRWIHSPFKALRRPFMPLEAWLYRKLR